MSKNAKKGKAPKPSQPKKGSNFDDAALSNLTSKLDQSLSHSTSKPAPQSQSQKRKTPPTKDAGKDQSKKPRKSVEARNESRPPVDQEALLAEIRALGGDEEDLALINGVDSDDEEVGSKGGSTDKKLQDEVAKMAKELGLAELVPPEPSDVEEEAEDDDEEDQDDSDADDAGDGTGSEAEEDGDGKSGNNGDTMRKVEGMLFEPRADWLAAPLRKLPKPNSDQIGPYKSAMDALQSHAQTLLDKDTAAYRASYFASSSHKFLSTIMSSGTQTDQVSALTLAIQESPVHNVKAFESLLNIASKKSRGQAITAIGALVDLLGPGSLLPSDRRLRTFRAQPGLLGALQKASVRSWRVGQPLPGQLDESHLIAWLYEDWLKATYFKIIQLLETWCADQIEYSRVRALDFVYGLLKEKPEQEANLLRLLVNKLGDRDRKIASRASYLLLQLQTSHPGMKTIIVRSVEQDILLRPSQDMRAKYYAINTLNQTVLSNKDPSTADSLMKIYFDLFVTLLKSGNLGIMGEGEGWKGEDGEKKNGKARKKQMPKEPELDAADKLVSAILTGVNRAAPFMTTGQSIMEEHLNTLFKIAHSSNFNTGIQALLLIQHLSTSKNLAHDRFYRVLYESLLDPRLISSSKQALYLNLLLRALQNDVDVRRVKAFAKRMLQIAGLHQPPFVCGLLYVLAHLRNTFPDLSTLIEEPEDLDTESGADASAIYDGKKREPEYSNANRSCLWELLPNCAHFHPSVVVFAAALLDKKQEIRKPDLDSHSLIRFLDKFVYKNAKAGDSARGTSIMQPLRSSKDSGDIWLGSSVGGSGATSVNSAAFWKKKAEDVAAEDVFFHEYFQTAAKEVKSKPQPVVGSDGEDEGAEDEIWKALVSSQPGAEDDDDDVGFDDLDDEDMASDDGSEPAFDLDSDMGDDDDVDIESDSDEGDDGLVQVGSDDGEEDADEDKKDDRAAQRKARRKAMKELPTFASVDDYAELLGQEDEDEDM